MNLFLFHQVQLRKKVQNIIIIIFNLIYILGLITPDSWKTYPVVLRNPPKKKPVAETVEKPTKNDEVSKPIVEQSSVQNKPRVKRPKRDTSLFFLLVKSII
jgi:hypothetical protein